MNTARTTLVFGALALSTIAIFLWRGGDDAAPADLAGASYAGWRAGDERAYDVDIRSTVDVRLGGGEGGAIVQELRGRLALRARDERTLDAVLADAALVVGRQRDDVRSRALSTPFVVELGGDGGVTACRFAAGEDESVTGRLDEMVRTFQAVGLGKGSPAWSADERHRDGVYRAEYERADGGRIAKRRVAAVGEGARIVTSTASIGLDEGPWIASMVVEEELKVNTGGHEADLRQRASLFAVPAESAVSAAFASAERAGAERARAEQAAAAEREANERRAPTAEERAQLDALLAALAESDGRDTKALLALRDLLRACPMLSGEIADALRAERIGGRAAGAAIHALELADHGPAQEALASICDDARQNDANRIRALVAIGGTTAPEPAIVDRLWRVAGEGIVGGAAAERADTARLSLGRLAASMREQDAARASAITDRLVAALDAAFDTGRASAALKAIGNAGDERASAAVSARLDASEPSVREAAAGALARIAPDGAGPVLAGRLGAESNARVRRALVEALDPIGPSNREAVDAVVRRARTEKDADVRTAMAVYLAPRLTEQPELRPLLEEMLETERNDRARRALAAALAR